MSLRSSIVHSLRQNDKKLHPQFVLMIHHVGSHERFSLSESNLVFFLQRYSDLIRPISEIFKCKNERSIFLTFDDGYEDVFNVAFPILNKYKVPFSCFLVKNFVGTKGYLSVDEVKTMQKSGLLTIGSHGETHSLLTSLSEAEIEHETLDSKQFLESVFSVTVQNFAYSHGLTNSTCIKSVKKNGYIAAFSASPDKPFHLKNKFAMPRYDFSDDTYQELLSFIDNVFGLSNHGVN
jgi:peptidoglycan/xylan/chitin deacetylase (PgdA/CDA1 family)